MVRSLTYITPCYVSSANPLIISWPMDWTILPFQPDGYLFSFLFRLSACSVLFELFISCHTLPSSRDLSQLFKNSEINALISDQNQEFLHCRGHWKVSRRPLPHE